MQETVLEVFERHNSIKELRKTGCVPGVLYGEGYEKGVPVAFDEAELKRIIKQHGANAKILVDFNGNRTLAFIKDLQRDNLTRKIIHSDIQVASQNHKIRMKLPIQFVGNIELEHRNLFLQVYRNHVEISGEANIIPEYITVNVSGMKLHETIKTKDLILTEGLKVYDEPDEVFATIIEMKGFEATEADITPEPKL